VFLDEPTAGVDPEGRLAIRAVVADLRAGKLDHEVPSHGTLIRVRRTGGLHAPRAEVASERAAAREQREARTAETK